MTNLQQLTDKIVREFEDRYGEVCSQNGSGLRMVTLDLEFFLTSAIKEAYEQALKDVEDCNRVELGSLKELGILDADAVSEDYRRGYNAHHSEVKDLLTKLKG